jgi:hypothetical protein
VAAPEVLHECVPSCDRARRGQSAESAHWPQPRLEPSMVGLNGVVNQYEDLGVAASAGRSRLAWGCWSAYGATVRDSGAGSEAGWAGRCYALG